MTHFYLVVLYSLDLSSNHYAGRIVPKREREREGERDTQRETETERDVRSENLYCGTCSFNLLQAHEKFTLQRTVPLKKLASLKIFFVGAAIRIKSQIYGFFLEMFRCCLFVLFLLLLFVCLFISFFVLNLGSPFFR